MASTTVHRARSLLRVSSAPALPFLTPALLICRPPTCVGHTLDALERPFTRRLSRPFGLWTKSRAQTSIPHAMEGSSQAGDGRHRDVQESRLGGPRPNNTNTTGPYNAIRKLDLGTPESADVSPQSVQKAVLESSRDDNKTSRRNKRTIRSRPAVGRMMEVNPEKGIDFGMAYRKLDMLLKQNSVKKDQLAQKFHERTGLKRKRLKSDRWRKLFKAGFQATIDRVQEMRRQGW